MLSKSRIHEIDGLRGIAILSVMFMHWFVQPLSNWLSQLGIREVLTLSAYGVDLFFVISGFLIGGILLKAGKKLAGIRSFYLRRILRIWPLYYLLIGLALLFTGGNAFLEVPFWSFFVFLFNFWESTGRKLHEALGPLWSIAIEEQFYIISPLVFFLLDRKYIARFALAYIALSPFLRLALTFYTEIGIWRFTLTRLDGICMGILLSIAFAAPEIVKFLSARLNSLRLLTLLLCTSAVLLKVLLPRDIWFSFGNSIVVLAFGALLTTVQVQCALSQSSLILNSSFLKYLGLRCYFIYLFHIFFMLLANAVTQNFFIGLLLQSILTVSFAHLSWKYLEAPLIEFGKRFPYESRTDTLVATE